LRAAAQVAGQLPADEPLASALRDPRELSLAGWPSGHDELSRPGGPAGREVLASLGALPGSGVTSGSAPGGPGSAPAGAGPGRSGFGRGGPVIPALAAARRVASLLALARETGREGTPHDVLWAVWDA